MAKVPSRSPLRACLSTALPLFILPPLPLEVVWKHLTLLLQQEAENW